MNLQLPSNLPSDLQGVKIVDLRGTLPVNPNYSWGELTGIRDLDKLTTQVFHHDAIPKYRSVQYSDIELVKRIATDHIRSKKNHAKGDPGFPYDAWIRNGIIYICNDLLPLKYGVASNNSYTVHICVSGDYKNYDTLTDADRNALYAAFFMFKAEMPSYAYLKGHKELQPTSCPGYSMDQVKKDITAIEQHIIFEQSEDYKRETAYKIANQTMYIYRMAQGKLPDDSPATDKQIKWAIDTLMKMYPFMQENKLFG